MHLAATATVVSASVLLGLSSLASQSPTPGMTPVGRGCPTPAVFYEQFSITGNGDLSGRSLWLIHTGNGYVVTDCANCFDPSFSGNLGAGDDSLHLDNRLGFDFPVLGDPRGTTDSVDVSSNGWIGLFTGDFAASDLSESVAEFLAQGPRVAVMWDDLDPSAQGGVYFDAKQDYALITWDSVPEFGGAAPNTFQCRLFPNGDMIWTWPLGADGDYLAGFSAGGGAADPGPIDITDFLPNYVGPFGTPLSLTGDVPTLGHNQRLELNSVPIHAALGLVNIGLQPSQLDLSTAGAPGCALLVTPQVSLPLTLNGSGSGFLDFPFPADPRLAGIPLHYQAVLLVPGINSLSAVTSNRLEGQVLEHGISVLCQGPNSYNSDTTSGFFQIVNLGGVPITELTFDWTASSNPAQATMEFDCDQSSMADAFWNGSASAGACGGTYRNNSDLLTGLNYRDARNNLISSCALDGENAGCRAGNQVGTTPDYRTLGWHFTGHRFANGVAFEFDIDTDGGAGTGGDDMAGLVVTIRLADGRLLTGEVRAAGTNLGRLDF